MDQELFEKWAAVAWTLPATPDALRAPFHILAGEALDVARFCSRNWKAVKEAQGGTPARPGLETAVGNGTFTANIAQEILELHDALQTAQSRYRMTVMGSGAAPMDRAFFVLGEIRATLEWYFDDGKIDESDAQLQSLTEVHGAATSQDAMAAALFDFAELADRHREGIHGLGGFDLALVEEARTLAVRLREQSAGPAQQADEPEQRQALELRNRLGDLLYTRMQRVRAAARFVFRGHPELIRQVTSAYARRQRANHRQVEPTGPVAPAPAAAAAAAP